MKISLALARTSLVVQESPACSLTFEAGAAGARIPNPSLALDEPVFRVASTAGATLFTPALGRARLRLCAPVPPSFEHASASLELAPGARRTFELAAIERFDFPSSGTFEVSALVRDEGATVASNAVTVSVLPLDPLRLDLEAPSAGFDDARAVAFVQAPSPARGTPASLHVRGFRKRGGQIVPSFSVRVTDVAPEVEPRLSVVPNLMSASQRLVAWLDPGTAESPTVHVARLSPTALLGTSSLPLSQGGTLVAPLVMDPTTNAARALILSSGAHPSLQSVVCRESGLALDGTPVTLACATPHWTRLLAPSQGEPVLLALADDGANVALHAISWRKGTSKVLGRWPGSFVAADAALDADDRIRGIVVLRLGGELTVITYSREATGAFAASGLTSWDWPRPLVGNLSRVRVDRDGRPHAIARGADGVWLYAAPLERPRPALPEGARVAGPVELAFLDGTLPLVLWHDPERGLMNEPIGFSLRPSSGPEVTLPEFGEPANVGGARDDDCPTCS